MLAFGWEKASTYLKDHSSETRRDVRIGVVSMSRIELPLAWRRWKTTGGTVVRAELDLELKTDQDTWEVERDTVRKSGPRPFLDSGDLP